MGNIASFGKTDGLTSDYVKSLAEDREGSLWIGTRDGLSQLTDVKFPTHQAAEDQLSKTLWRWVPRAKGVSGVGSSAGLTYFDGQPKTYGVEAGLTNLFIKRVLRLAMEMFISSAGPARWWFFRGKSRRVLFRNKYVGGAWRRTRMALWRRSEVISTAWEPITSRLTLLPTSKPTLAWVLNLASGRDGEIWVACGAGIFRVKDGAFQQWAADAPAWTIVQWVCEDSDGVVWGAQLTGIVRLKDNQLRYINRTNGLFDNNIYSIVPDDFWQSLGGLQPRYFSGQPQEHERLRRWKTGQVRCVAYDGPESVKPAAKHARTRWGARRRTAGFGSPAPTGLVEGGSRAYPDHQIPPPVHIDLVRANGIELVRDISTTCRPARANWNSILPALSFSRAAKCGSATGWKVYDKDCGGSERPAPGFLHHLKPGRYTFRVIAANAGWRLERGGDTLPIECARHYYQTGWFDLLCGGPGLAALIGFISSASGA